MFVLEYQFHHPKVKPEVVVVLFKTLPTKAQAAYAIEHAWLNRQDVINIHELLRNLPDTLVPHRDAIFMYNEKIPLAKLEHKISGKFELFVYSSPEFE